MTAPAVKAEMAFGAVPFADPAIWTWTDITTDVVGDIVISRGRPTELDEFPSGTCALALSNETRKYDPEHAAGAHFGQLIENVPLRVTVTGAGGPRVRFLGFVDSWSQQYAPPASATCAITATDGFKLINRTLLPESVYAWEVAKDNPKVWLRLGEPSGSIARDSSGHGYDGVWNRGDSQLGKAPLIDGTSDTAGGFIGAVTGDLVEIANSAARIDATPLIFEVWLRSDAALVPIDPHVSRALAQQVYDGTGFGIRFHGVVPNNGSIVGGYVNVVYRAGATQASYSTHDGTQTTAEIFDDEIHHVVFYNPGTPHIVVDGVDQVITTGVAFLSAKASRIQIGGLDTSTTTMPSWPGVLDEFAMYDTDIGLARIQAHYAAGHEPWNNDSTGTRFGRVLDILGWPTSMRAIDAGEASLGPATLAGRIGHDYLQSVALTEGNRYFISRDGKVTLHSRDHDLVTTVSNTSQATFTDDGTGIEYEPDVTVANDGRYVFNTITAQRDGGAPVTVTDAASVTANGPQSKSFTGLMLRNDAEVRNRAEAFLYRYKTPHPRLDRWTVKPLASTSDWQTLLELDCGYRITHAMKPQNTGSRVSRQLLIESIVETYPAGATAGATFVFTASPADPSSYFVWGTSNWDGADVWR